MLNPMSAELLSRELTQRRIAEAAQQALADQVPRSPMAPPLVVVRHALAFGLRGLAVRLDPSVTSEPRPRMAVASPR